MSHDGQPPEHCSQYRHNATIMILDNSVYVKNDGARDTGFGVLFPKTLRKHRWRLPGEELTLEPIRITLWLRPAAAAVVCVKRIVLLGSGPGSVLMILAILADSLPYQRKKISAARKRHPQWSRGESNP